MLINLTLCLYEVDFLGEHSSDYTPHFETLVNAEFTIFVKHIYTCVTV